MKRIYKIISGLLIALGLGSCVPETASSDPHLKEETEEKIKKSEITPSGYQQRDACEVTKIKEIDPPFQISLQNRGIGSFIQRYSHGNFPISGGPGVSIGDINNDSFDDIYLPTTESMGRLYINDGTGRFTQANNSPPGPQLAIGSIMFDYNNDDFQDILIIGAQEQTTNRGSTRIYRNEGEGEFVDTTNEIGITNLPGGARFSGAVCDIDNDGDLDIIIGGYINGNSDNGLEDLLFVNQLNRGEERFVEEAAKRGLNQTSFGNLQGFTYAVLCTDINRDGLADIIMGNDGGLNAPNEAYVNQGNGTFIEQAQDLGLNYSYNQKGFPRDGADTMGIAFGDMNLDGLPDILMSNYTERTTLAFQGYLEEGRIRFRDVARDIGFTSTNHTNWGIKFVDPDNDMDEDIISASAIPIKGDYDSTDQYLKNEGLNEGNTIYREILPSSDRRVLERDSYGLVVSDLDLDGRIDVIISNKNQPPTILSAVPTNGNYILYKLRGTVSNRDAVGSIVRITARNGCTIEKYRHIGGSFASSDSAYIHSGLGPAEYAETTVIWPTGEIEEFGELEANHVYELEEGSGKARIIK